jgi:hypothetical protein
VGGGGGGGGTRGDLSVDVFSVGDLALSTPRSIQVHVLRIQKYLVARQ